MFTRLLQDRNTDYTCTALTVLNKTQREKLEVIQNHCLRYARGAVYSTCISSNKLHSRCNIVSVEQRILADSWWKKASNSNYDIINFTYHPNRTVKQKHLWISSKVISSSNPCNIYIILQYCSNIFNYFQTQTLPFLTKVEIEIQKIKNNKKIFYKITTYRIQILLVTR